MDKKIAILLGIILPILLEAQNVGIGTNNPTEKLSVSGNVGISGEIKPGGSSGLAGQVLSSTGNGTMQWSNMPVASSEVLEGYGSWGDCEMNNVDSYYPVVDPSGQFYNLLGSDVDMSADWVIAGNSGDSLGLFPNAGSALLYKFNTTTNKWDYHSMVVNPNGQTNDYFGGSVAISGDYLIVGSSLDDELTKTNTGSATIFRRNLVTGVWESQGKITNPDAQNNDNFGNSVDIDGDFAIVGAKSDEEGGFTATGSATIFKRNATSGIWESQGKLTDPVKQNLENFGHSVAIRGNYAIVGANNDSELGKVYTGSATIFKRDINTGVWEMQIKLTNILAEDNDEFGASVEINEDWALIGAPGDTESNIIGTGSVSVFKRNPTNGLWQGLLKITNSQKGEADNFGNAICFSEPYLIVGSMSDTENGLYSVGSASIFKRYGNIWQFVEKITSPGTLDEYSYFGRGVAIHPSYRRFVVGSPGTALQTGMLFFGRVR